MARYRVDCGDTSNRNLYRNAMRRFMKNYLATFVNRDGTEISLAADGISLTHASARAWISFMKTQSYKENEDSWKLETLKELVA